MKNKLQIFFIFIILFGGCTTRNATKWVETTNGILIYSTPVDSVSYQWDGDSFMNIAHGNGSILEYKNDSLIKKYQVNAYYGAIDKKYLIQTTNGDLYVGDIVEEKFNGYGVLIKISGELYIGCFENGRPNGTLTWFKNNNIYYQGEWSNGEFNGDGVLYKEDGQIRSGRWINGRLQQTTATVETEKGLYSGEILNSKPDGFGKMTYKGGAYFEGGWKQGNWHNEGVFINSQQDTLLGLWNAGKLEGYGLLKSKSFFYEGEWINNAPDGLGYGYYQDSSFYAGQWKCGKRNGYGDLISGNSDSYFGNWVDDKRNGHGHYNYANGDTYNGEWLNDYPHGLGRFISKEYCYSGNWEEGWINGIGHITYQNGDSYNGSFVENEKYGSGTYFYGAGNVYEGEFVNDTFNGLGVFYFADGNRYEGEFINGRINGEGSLFYSDAEESLIITAHWDGTTNFPKEASVLFENGDLYEGPLLDGFPTKDGTWTTEQERLAKELVAHDNRSKASRANDFYKKHKATWNKVVKYTSYALIAVEITTKVAAVAVVVCPLTAPAAPALLAVSYGARVTNIGINALDASVAVASASIDASEALQKGEDPSDVLSTLGGEIAINTALIAMPSAATKIVSKLSIRQSAVVLSGFAKHSTKKVVSRIGKTKLAGKIVCVTKNAKGYVEKKYQTSRLGIFIEITKTAPKNQYITNKEYEKVSKSTFGTMKHGLDASAGVLRHNMEFAGGQKFVHRMSFENKLSKAIGERIAQAHHIVAGNSPTAKRSREILSKFGIDINDARNGILLPMHSSSIMKGTLHGRHKSSYDDFIYNRLKNAKTQRECLEVLDQIKKELYDGQVELLTNHSCNTIFKAFKNIFKNGQE